MNSTTSLTACFGYLLATWNVFAQVPIPLRAFPPPEKTFQDDKQFNALTLGPGNSFSIHEAPPDLQLDSFDFSSDGKLLFMCWASGRLEIRDIQSAERIAQVKPESGPVFEVETNGAIRDWLTVGRNGLLRFVDPTSGKTIREIHTEIGRFKYDIQKVLFAPDGTWLAYVNQENGKVLDLKSDPPKVLATLGDAYDIALSTDKSQLWAVDRKEIFGIATSQWTRLGIAPLIDQVRPDGNVSLAVVDSKEGAIAFVPSKSGLLRYQLNTMDGTRVTENPAYTVFSARGDLVIVNEFHATSVYAADGDSVVSGGYIRHRDLTARRSVKTENGLAASIREK